MFSKHDMSVGDWWLFYILMAIPIVNVVMFFVILLSSGVNKSLKNYLLAMILPVIIIVSLLLATGVLAGFAGNA